MQTLEDYIPEEFGANKDGINSLIMEQASESAEAHEIEKIQSLKAEIKERHEKMKQSMFLLVQMLGEEVKSLNGRTYKATEDTGVNCVVESFVIEDEKLMVKTDFDGDKFTLELDSFHAEELANILYLMLDDNKKHLQSKIENMFKAYVNQHNEEPRYVCCCIKYLDNSPLVDVTLKLNNELDVQDDSLFYYSSDYIAWEQDMFMWINDECTQEEFNAKRHDIPTKWQAEEEMKRLRQIILTETFSDFFSDRIAGKIEFRRVSQTN